jgi:DNA-binding transcriptional MerR regulator
MASEGYLRIGELARRTGVSPELLRAWESRYGLLEPDRSEGGFRLYSDADEARVRRTVVLMAQGLSAGEAARRAREDPAEVLPAPAAPLGADATRDLQRALETFDEAAAHVALDRLFGTFSVETVLREAILPYLRGLGERWEAGEVSVAQEHFASNVLRGRLLGIARGWGTGGTSLAVLACPPGEDHELALIAFGIAIWRRGWRVAFLGANTPFDTLEEVVRTQRPTAVVLAITDPGALQRHADAIATLARTGRVLVGGNVDVDEVSRLGARMLEGDPVQAARALVA